jgi:glutamate dehydrogenase (NAD(P)+)
MTDPFSLGDDLGPAKVIHVQEPTIGLKGILVVDNVAAGPAIGGLRMAEDVSTGECFRLARAMTLKNAAAGLRHGGGKSVLFGDPKMPPAEKERLIRGFAAALADVSDYIFGPDMGTDEVCMGWVHDEIGRSVGLIREIGGIPLDEIGATGWGLFHAAEVACAHLRMPLSGARVVVQGFGAVGRHAAGFLAARGAVLVGASDSRGTISDPAGLDLEALAAVKQQGGTVADVAGGTKGGVDAVIDIPCDIWIPAARPDVITEANVERLHTKLVLQGANVPITYEAECRLHEKGILSLPDFIANAGGVICAAMEYAGASEGAALRTIEEKLRRNTEEVLVLAQEKQVSPRDAASELAVARVRRAMAIRRWSIPAGRSIGAVGGAGWRG